MDQMANFVASGWKHDLTHFIGCCWVAQIGSLEWDEWRVAITKFLAVMAKRKAREWTDIKELTPLQFMPYMAKLFKEVTGQDLQGLSHFTGWIGQGGYYHWRVVQQGLIHLALTSQGSQCLRLQMPNQGGQPSTPGQSGMTTAPRQGGKSSTPCQSGEPASTSGSGTPAASGGPSNLPPGREGAGDGTGTDWYVMYMRETQGRISEPPGPPYPIGPAEVRREAVGQIYD